MTVRLELLGGARLLKPDGPARLERRTAAVLAHLALEGEAVKYRLAGWLWPDSPEATARNNMRQLLRRARNQTGLDLVVGEDRIQLAEAVTADAAEVQTHAFAGEHARVLEFEGELLDGLEFDDCPDFEEWLLNAREGIAGLRRNASVAESERLEKLGDFAGAVRFALEHVRLEPISEEAHRRVMRLRYLMGDRAAALAAFEQLERLLKRELGVEPLPETLELMRQIERGSFLPVPAAQARNVPLSVLRPPVLVGREREWAQLEAAWVAGLPVFICGEPGSGKSRLAHDFAASKGPIFRFSGRPGDAGVPFSSQARGLQDTLQAQPGLLRRLPDWVRSELSRLLPELNPGEPLPPLASEAEKLRLYHAFSVFLRMAREDNTVTVADDVQFVDRASTEMMMYLWGQIAPSEQTGAKQVNTVSRVINAYRRGDLASDLEAMISGLVEAGLAVRIELEPLGTQAVNALLEGLDLPETRDLGPALTRYTGGNPLFMLETIKHLWETGQLQHGWPGRLPPPGKVGPLVQRRLERLSATALNLAQAAAVLQRDYSFELVTQMLGLSSTEALPAWAELEAAQVMANERFSHDLVFEAVQAGLLESVRRFLNRRAAEVLEASGVRGARVAEHWLAGFDPVRAAPQWLVAAEQAVAALRLSEAADFFARAADALEGNNDLEAAFEARYAELRQRLEVDAGEGTQSSSERLLRLARTPRQRAQARLAQAMFLSTQGQFAEIEAVARAGLEDAALAGDLQLEADLLEAAATVPMTLGKPEDAIPMIERMVGIYRELNNPLGLATATLGLGLARRHFDRPKALEYFREAQVIAARANLANEEASAVNNIARSSGEIGLVEEALGASRRAYSLLRETGGAIDTQLVSLSGLARHLRSSGEYTQALEATGEALRLGEGRQFAWLGMIHLGRAQILRALGDYKGANASLEVALAWPGFPAYNRLLLNLVYAEFDPSVDLAAMLPDLGARGDAVLLCEYRLLEAQRATPQAALKSLALGIEVAVEQHLGGLQTALLVRQAQALLKLERHDAALSAISNALELNRTFMPAIGRPELWLTHHQVLTATHAENALEPLETALRWLEDTASHRVPAEHRHGFLQRNPIHRALLEIKASLDANRR